MQTHSDTRKPAADVNGTAVEVSVVCPFYNEEGILEAAISTLLRKLAELEVSWELLVVSDGSTDRSRDIADDCAKKNPKLRVLGYEHNQGRGYALRTGIASARGNIVITTEIDLSWGEDVVYRLYQAMLENPAADIVIASPHLEGGGYRNVPSSRVFFSRFGNLVIRLCMGNLVTMNTGMTRAYRRNVIRALPLAENGKEFHLEVVLKAHALNYHFAEIPALLEWKQYKLAGKRVERKSSSKVKKLVLSHSLFSLFANPIRYVWGLAGLSTLMSIGFIIWGVARLVAGEVSVYTLMISLSFGIIATLLFAFGVIAQQGNMIQTELWKIQRQLKTTELDKTVSVTSVVDRPEE
jgi:glycosyltransferase involved in cell wall biosynthesis